MEGDAVRAPDDPDGGDRLDVGALSGSLTLRRRGLAVLAALLVLPAARFECRLGSGLAGTDGLARVRAVVVSPSAVTLPVGGKVPLEGTVIDEFGRRAHAALTWSSLDPEVASVAPRRAVHATLDARSPGRTLVTAVHRSGPADTVSVTVARDRF